MPWNPDDLTSFRSGGRSFVVLVRDVANDENVAIHELYPDGKLSQKLIGYVLGSGWSRVRRFDAGGRQYCLLYRHNNNGSSTVQTYLLDEATLFQGEPRFFQFDDYAHAHLVLCDRRLAQAEMSWHETRRWTGALSEAVREDLYNEPLAGLDQDAMLDSVNGSVGDCFIQTSNDALLLQSGAASRHRKQGVAEPADWIVRRMTTTLAETVSKRLLTEGIDGLLRTESQLEFHEADLPLTVHNQLIDDVSTGSVLDGPFGVYYREILLHIPWMIAKSLTPRGRYADAQRWYHYLFDPTASETDSTESDRSDVGTPADRVFRYMGFRQREALSLRKKLADKDSIDAFRNDPFNPHAIARLHESEEAKAVVLAYVDNLLDWADSLFATGTPPTIREASLLYSTPHDILGPRPNEMGSCGESQTAHTFAGVEERLSSISPFLIELEHLITVGIEDEAAIVGLEATLELTPVGDGTDTVSAGQIADVLTSDRKSRSSYVTTAATTSPTHQPHRGTSSCGHLSVSCDAHVRPLESWQNAMSHEAGRTGIAGTAGKEGGRALETNRGLPTLGSDILRQLAPIFCIPRNHQLMDAWDRLEDRLYKIRTCKNIDGSAASTDLFAPAIDPGMLAAARATGLQGDELLAEPDAAVPPQRFTFVLQHAMRQATTVQSLGASLMSLLERQDAEELGPLRAVHEEHLLKVATEIQDWEAERD